MDENRATVIFQPYGIRGEVSKGVSVIEAARCLGVGIESICGGNAAGDGCRAALFSLKKRREADWCSLNVEYSELTLQPEFEREFMEAMHQPHMRDDYPHLQGIVRPEILHQGINTSKQELVFVVREFKHNGDDVHLRVDPGICGFPCTVSAQKLRGRVVELSIEGSDCRQTQRLSELISRMKVRDVLRPARVNPIFVSAEKAGCCSSCPVPTALIKAAEVALGLALERDIIMHFQTKA